MLNAMRDGTQSKFIKIILFTFLLLAMMGMVMTDVGGFFRSGGVGMSAVAKAGKDNIGVTQFDQVVRRTLSQQGMTPQDAYRYGLVDRVLQNQIGMSLATQAAMDYGFYIGDNEVVRQINSIIEPQLKQQPGITRADILKNFLRSQSMSEQELVTTLRTGIMNSLLQSTIQAGGLTPSRREAQALYVAQNETRDLETLFLSDDSIKDTPPADEAILNALYDASKSLKYAIPETRSFTIAILTEAQARDSLTITDDELQKEYDQNIAAYTQAERRVVEQAVFTNEDDATKAIAAVKDGKKLKEAAGKNFQGEQTYDRNGLAADITQAVFDTAEETAVGPFKSPLGWSVMTVKKTLPEEIKSFDSVKGDIRKQVLQLKTSEHLFNTANTIDDRLAGGEDLTSVAEDMGLKMESIGPVREDGSTPDQHEAMKNFEKDRPYILKSAFDLMEGETAPVMELSDGSYATIRIDAITPRSFKPFAEVRGDIEKTWLQDQRAAENKIRSGQAQQMVASGEKTLAQLGAEYGAKIKKLNKLKRNTTDDKTLSPEAITIFFNGAKDEFVLAPVPGGYMIAQVTSITLPDKKKISDKDIDEVIAYVAKGEKDEMMQVYMHYIENKMGSKINRNLLDKMYGPESGT